MTDISYLLEPGEKLERCGFILKSGEVVEVTNVSETPEQAFRMAPAELIKHADDAEATWHTHPDADPNLSEQDRVGFLQWPKLKHYIVGMRQGQVKVCGYFINDGLVLSL